jgi:transposase
MINPEKRKVIYMLYTEGMPVREISKRLQVDRNTVRRIILEKGEVCRTQRCDRIEPDSELITRLYVECKGYIRRIHEKLVEEHNFRIGYSTLTQKIRELGLGKPKNQRCDHVPDKPGAEMQHDTTIYNVQLGEQKIKVVASLLYLRYSKMRYLKFYRNFNRFVMKGFLHEALMFWGFSAPVCIIDNTNLARYSGIGSHAVIVSEMEQFAINYGFKFVCHEKGHANRKAGNERSFYTVETNFFPGRRFENLKDLNQQALDWTTVRMANRPVSKTGLIPTKAFEYEQAYLTKLPVFIPPPYLEHERYIDQYGYISFEGNFYWIPGLKRFDVKVLQYPDSIKIYHQHKMLIEHELPVEGEKNQKYSPPGQPQSKYQPANRKKSTSAEESKLRLVSESVSDWLNLALADLQGKAKHRVIRQLYYLYQKMSSDLFKKTINRALTYRVTDIHAIERICVLLMKEGEYSMPQASIGEDFINRPSFTEGQFTDEVDLSVYRDLGEDDHE